MSNVTTGIVAKLWNLCNVLKDDGVTYHQYVTELTYLLFLKMAKEIGVEVQIPERYRWDDLSKLPASDRLEAYEKTLVYLGTNGSSLVQQIFANAASFIRKPLTLSTLVAEIDSLDWYSAKQDGLGDLYEGLLQKNANEKKSGAGQYFTPRSLIDAMVAVTRPTLDDIIQDPAAGTAGFLISANHYIRKHSKPDRWTETQKWKYRNKTFFGMEHVQDTHRLALMNLMLHGIDSNPGAAGVRYGDTLSQESEALPKATLILTNPPFGTKKGGGLPSRKDFTFETSNKQLCFLQHIYGSLEPRGRAAVVMPDNVLFEGNIARHIRTDLMDKCNLHTILRLPTGIFYAPGVKTNVLFFTRGRTDRRNTKEVWVYDLQTDMAQFGRRTGITRAHFREFEQAYGTDPFGDAKSLRARTDTGDRGRFRRFSRGWIADRGDNMDILWLNSVARLDDDLPSPNILASEAVAELERTIVTLKEILAEIGKDARYDNTS